MTTGTKILVWGCGAMALLCLFLGNYHAVSGFVTAFIGWLTVGFHERREVK